MGLAEHNLTIGDIVTYRSNKDSTGGVVFQISENCDPVKHHNMISHSPYSYVLVDEKGKKIPTMCIKGYIRLRSIFSFFPTDLGEKPKGKKNTVLVYHNDLGRVKKVELLTIATKYAELGNLIRDIAKDQGM